MAVVLCVDSAKAYLGYYYFVTTRLLRPFASESGGLRASRSKLSKPLKARATLLPVYSESCEMKIREQQNQNLQQLKNINRQQEEEKGKIYGYSLRRRRM